MRCLAEILLLSSEGGRAVFTGVDRSCLLSPVGQEKLLL